MARSNYIYALTEPEGVVAAFTVKHEMESFLKREFQEGGEIELGYRVIRLRDAKPEDGCADISKDFWPEQCKENDNYENETY